MAKVLNKEEKLALIETFPLVMNAKDDGTTHQFTRGGWIKYFMASDYLNLADNVNIRTQKPDIDSTIWYDDEYESPAKSRDIVDVFIDHNMEYNRPSRLYEDMFNDSNSHSYVALYNTEHPDDTVIRRIRNYNDDFEIQQLENAGYERYQITENDINAMRNFFAEQDKKYEKRLRTYAKRYKYKISCRGYWANR